MHGSMNVKFYHEVDNSSKHYLGKRDEKWNISTFVSKFVMVREYKDTNINK
jgi:hypothetical protein